MCSFKIDRVNTFKSRISLIFQWSTLQWRHQWRLQYPPVTSPVPSSDVNGKVPPAIRILGDVYYGQNQGNSLNYCIINCTITWHDEWSNNSLFNPCYVDYYDLTNDIILFIWIYIFTVLHQCVYVVTYLQFCSCPTILNRETWNLSQYIIYLTQRMVSYILNLKQICCWFKSIFVTFWINMHYNCPF